jgi:hypothetical protein
MLSVGVQREFLGEHAAVVRGGNDAVVAVDDQAAGGGLLVRAQADAVDDRLGLRLPVEEDAEHADRLAMGLAVLADGRRVRRREPVLQGGHRCDVGDGELGAVGGSQGIPEPRRVGHVLHRGGGIAVGTAVRQHPTFEVHDPEVQVHGVGIEDHPETTAAVGGGLRILAGRAVHHGGVRGPPAHVAGTFVKVAVDDLDHVQGEIGESCSPKPRDERVSQGVELPDARIQSLLESGNDLGDLVGDGFHLAGDDGEADSGLPGACRLDGGVHRQQLGGHGDPVDVSHPLGNQGGDLVSKSDDSFRHGCGGSGH